MVLNCFWNSWEKLGTDASGFEACWGESIHVWGSADGNKQLPRRLNAWARGLWPRLQRAASRWDGCCCEASWHELSSGVRAVLHRDWAAQSSSPQKPCAINRLLQRQGRAGDRSWFDASWKIFLPSLLRLSKSFVEFLVFTGMDVLSTHLGSSSCRCWSTSSCQEEIYETT